MRTMWMTCIGLALLAGCGPARPDGVLGTESDRTGSRAPIILSAPRSSKSEVGSSSPAPRSAEREVGSSRSSVRAQSSSARSEPASIDISIPFTSQAPLGRWDPLHQEACEEAALIMVHHFLEGTGITKEEAEAEIQALVRWEELHGYRKDITAEQLATIARDYYGYRAYVDDDTSADHLRSLLAAGKPIIVPMAGRQLGNPYFTGAGPWYHMLVARGYGTGWFRGRFFITNDPGTRRGEKYTYDEAIFRNAIHDWVGVNERIAEGGKRVVIVEKE